VPTSEARLAAVGPIWPPEPRRHRGDIECGRPKRTGQRHGQCRRRKDERADVTTDGQVSLSNGTLQRKRTHKRSFCTRPSDSRLSRRQPDADKPGAPGTWLTSPGGPIGARRPSCPASARHDHQPPTGQSLHDEADDQSITSRMASLLTTRGSAGDSPRPDWAVDLSA
jgi:hypothetical protein